MTDTHDCQSLSNLELLVLARLSQSEGANEDDLAAAIAEVAPPDEPRSARDDAQQALAALQRRSLATRPKATKRITNPRSHLTEEGSRVLRTSVGQVGRSIWSAVRGSVPALGLGVSKTFEQATRHRNASEFALAVLRRYFSVPQASTATALCDALIARKLGFTGPVTLARLRLHVLVQDLGFDAVASSAKEFDALARRAANRIQDETVDGTPPRQLDGAPSWRQELGRRWAYRATGSAVVFPGPRLVTTPSTRPALATDEESNSAPAQRAVSGSPARTTSGTASPPTSPGPATTPGDNLLTLVREAIPRIGADGRFGDEKVFVSAIWRYLEDDGRLSDWSLDRFKRWLVTANRDQLVDLARADAQGDMDGGLVEESEINDRGATFHFVVDRKAASLGRGVHAR